MSNWYAEKRCDIISSKAADGVDSEGEICVMECRNLMEELVDKRLDELMSMANMCGCPQCRADVRALALNRLPPRYITSIKGDVFVRFEAQSCQEQAEVAGAIVRAIEIVRKNPRHKGDTGSR